MKWIVSLVWEGGSGGTVGTEGFIGSKKKIISITTQRLDARCARKAIFFFRYSSQI